MLIKMPLLFSLQFQRLSDLENEILLLKYSRKQAILSDLSLMDYENRTSTPTQTATPEEVPALVKKIGKTTYKERVHFSKTSTETMSDKIKRLPKNEIQQM